MIKSQFCSSKLKYSIIIMLSLMISNFSYSQDFHHGFGAQLDYGIFTLEYTSPTSEFSDTSTPFVPGIFYKASLSFSDKFAISAYPFLGLSGSVNSREGGSLSVGVQLPVVAELYFGDIDNTCFFLGAGLSYASLGSSDFGSGKAFGPQFSIGGQVDILRRLVGVRLATTFGLNSTDKMPNLEYTKDTHTVISLGTYYTL